MAEPGTAYRAVLHVSHGCDGSPTTSVAVQLPPGLRDAKPEAKTEGLKSPAVLLQVQALPALKVEQGWVRPSVPGQQGTGGYMLLTARKTMRLVGVVTPAAGVAEVHEMKMEGDVMRMRALAGGLELPAGKTVELKPGGLHLMLMDLKQPLAAGTSVPVTLNLRDEKGAASQLEVKLAVTPAAPGRGASATEGHRH